MSIDSPSYLYTLIRSNLNAVLGWLTIVVGSFVLLSLLLPIQNFQRSALLLVLVSAAVLPWALLYSSSAEPRSALAVGTPILVVLNLLSLYFCQIWFSAYNYLLIVGVALMVLCFYSALLYRCNYRRLQQIRWLINALIALALLLAIPDVNGVHMTMLHISKPTKVGIYPVDSNISHNSERYQHFQHLDEERIDDPVKIKLRSPVAGNTKEAVWIMLKPVFPAEFIMLSLSLVNYLAYDARIVERFNSTRIRQVEHVGGTPTLLRFDQASLIINRFRGYVWLEVPIDTPSDIRTSSPARSNNLIRALLYWQILWFLCIVLAPSRYLHRKKNGT